MSNRAIKSFYIFGLLLLCGSGLLITACQDQMFADIGQQVIEGEPATVSLSLKLEDRQVLTRADATAENTVNDLWVGIYNEESDELTGSKYLENLSNQAHGTTVDFKIGIGEIDTKSGMSHIVAVANVSKNYGISDAGDSYQEGGKLSTLKSLLEDAKTWKDFKKISVIQTDSSSVSVIDANMVMCGVYYEENKDPDSWDAENEKTYYISPGANNLSGAIHLRRLQTKVQFNITAANYVTVEPLSWRVFNIPFISYLHEQKDNSADVSTFFLEGNSTIKDNYGTSSISYQFGNDTEKNVRTFTFYQYENKHQGLEWVEDYVDREVEYKRADGTNTGIYKSLCFSDDVPDTKTGTNVDNYATYVEIIAKVSYYIKDSDLKEPENATPVPEKYTENGTTHTGIPRTGFATYTVHLGYCEGADDEAAKSRDFNCRRNTSYIYNMEIQGLNKIVLEARTEDGEKQPGAEGDVTDTVDELIDLDAHYGVFNIKLTKEERESLQWKIQAPYDNVNNTLASSSAGVNETDELRADKFYKWIRFKPTTDEKTLASYREKNISDEDADKALWTLENLRDTENFNSSTDYYTVFIDEYVYDESENDITSWKKYVNQDDRIVWLNVLDKSEDPETNQNLAVSKDGESTYAKTKYMITQRSIQTYYSFKSENGAMGVEHVNETYGKRLDWTWGNNSNSTNNTVYENLSAQSGRKNMWYFIQDKKYDEDSNGWASVIENIPDGLGYRVPQLKSATASSNGTARNTYDPQSGDTQYYEIMAACMSRNRDLDGDGKISADEMKWYLPSTGRLGRVMLGRNALRSPLFTPNVNRKYYTNPTDYNKDNVEAAGKNLSANLTNSDIANEVHYATSDMNKFFVEQGGCFFETYSNGNGTWVNGLNIAWPSSGTSHNYWTWNIRCTRNLGVSQAITGSLAATGSVEDFYSSETPVKAYTYVPTTEGKPEEGGVFKMNYYDESCLRLPIFTFIPAHTVLEFDRNAVASSFQVSKSDWSVTGVNCTSTSVVEGHMNANRPCNTYAEATDGSDLGKWRAPNQRELMMMANESGLLTGTAQYFSCTKEAYYPNPRFIIVTNTDNNGVVWQMQACNTYGNSLLRVRCVRDVIENVDTNR